jgi:hypothetical protein
MKLRMKYWKISIIAWSLFKGTSALAGIDADHAFQFQATIISISEKNIIVSNGIEQFFIPKKFLKYKSITVSDNQKVLNMKILPFELEALIMVNNARIDKGGSGGTGGGR